MTNNNAQLEQWWKELVHADEQFYGASLHFWYALKSEIDQRGSISAVVDLFDRALSKSNLYERGAALRFLLNSPALLNLTNNEDSVRENLFPRLVYLASTDHADTPLVRDVLIAMERAWVLEHLPEQIEQVLAQSSTYDEYRRFAELLAILHSPYLQTLCEKAKGSDDIDIREVAEDFGDIS